MMPEEFLNSGCRLNAQSHILVTYGGNYDYMILVMK